MKKKLLKKEKLKSAVEEKVQDQVGIAMEDMQTKLIEADKK